MTLQLAANAFRIPALAHDVLQAATAVRANAKAARAISRRANEMAEVVDAILGANIPPAELQQFQALETFEICLLDAKDTLLEIGHGSYLAQLIHQQRDREKLQVLSEKLSNAFRVLMVGIRMQTNLMASSLSAQIDALLDGGAASQLRNLEPTGLSEQRMRLPPMPALHFGRVRETEEIVRAVVGEAPSAGRVAVLGGPGMGKTSLALTVLHHPSVADRFGARRIFVSCEGAEGQTGLLSTIAAAFGVPSSERKTLQQRLKDMIAGDASILVLDNFESAWEKAEHRASAEQVLQFLDSVDGMSLIITMRGAERPQGAQWTRPFLPPLEPLDDAAASQTFLSIADVLDPTSALSALLSHLDNIPLAVVLMANLAQVESPETLLCRWKEVETAMLVSGDGRTRLTSLDISLRLSLECARMKQVSSAYSLLSCLALLPYGVCETDIALWNIKDAAPALSVLLQTSLALRSADGQIKVLSPVRSFVLSHYPPSDAAADRVLSHYLELAIYVRESMATGSYAEVFAISHELSNIGSVIRYVLDHRSDLQPAALDAAFALCYLYAHVSIGPGVDLLPVALAFAEKCGLRKLQAKFLSTWGMMAVNALRAGDPHSLFSQARDIYVNIDDADGILDTGISLLRFTPPPEAVAEGQRLFAIAESRQDSVRMARCAQCLASAFARATRVQDAIAQYKLCISIMESASGGASHMRNGLVGLSKFQLARHARMAGDLKGAVVMFQEALDVLDGMRLPIGVSYAHRQRAQALMLLGRPLDAIARLNASAEVHRAAGRRHQLSYTLMLALAKADTGNMEEATALLESVSQLNSGREWTFFEHSDILHARGCLALSSGDASEACALFRVARSMARRKDPVMTPESMLRTEASIMETLSQAELAAGRSDEAATLAISTAILARRLGDTIYPIRCLVLLAEAAEDDIVDKLVDAALAPLHRIGLEYDLAKLLLCSAVSAQKRGQRNIARHRAQNALNHFGQVDDRPRIQLAKMLIGA